MLISFARPSTLTGRAVEVVLDEATTLLSPLFTKNLMAILRSFVSALQRVADLLVLFESVVVHLLVAAIPQLSASAPPIQTASILAPLQRIMVVVVPKLSV